MIKKKLIFNKTNFSETIYLLTSIYILLESKTKRKVFLTFFIMVISSFFESLSILAVIPLISKLIGFNQTSLLIEKIQGIYFLDFINKNNNFVFIFFIILIIISGIIKTFDLYNCAQLTVQATHDLSKKTYFDILRRPYYFHVYGEISNLMAILTTYIRDTHELIYNFLRIISSLLILISLIITLFIVNVKITLFSFLILSVVYFLLAAYSRNKLIRTSSQQVISSNLQAKLIQESLLSIRELKIWSAYKLFNINYEKIDWDLRTTQRTRMFLGSFPRYLIEIVGIITIVIICLLSKDFTKDGSNIIPIIGTFALGVQRLLPSFNQIYVGWSYINSFKNSTKKILEILYDNSLKDDDLSFRSKYKIKSHIEFKDVSFKYPNSEKSIFHKINFKVNKGEIVGIKGRSGIGKSTLIDLLSGMLLPDGGSIFIDDKLLNDKKSNNFLLSWRSSLAYVSQNIYFMKGTFLENIAFGVSPKNINFKRVKYVSKLAMIDEFINSFPKNYYDTVFENGRNLSGGQKQRLGIARALYHTENIIIFDEATSALDPSTEIEIFANIIESNKEITIFIISHNPHTLNFCNNFIEIKAGKIIKK